ncbi:TetR/AcrR family transcriptional regulator [Saccharothrix deserti]|uniref:TetR/AcrR family transcriptional regulator n=1 Tax=Saccharothrix deserti TaxID=2593674 RepID=UPI00131A89DF|nr:TetR/AcrR family transcriptional regulator [Saccharothrix deserti]
MDERTGAGLPSVIEAAWGVRERPGKGRQRGLSLDRIVEAAVNVAESEGLAAVSMSRVAAELGASTMALYRYVVAKEELLVLMSDAAYRTPPSAVVPGEPWRTALSRWAWDLHAILRQHTWVLRIPVTGPPVTPNQVIWLEHGLRCLQDTGLPEREKLSVMMLLTGFVRNEASVIADVTEAFVAADADQQEAMSFYGQLLGKLADPNRFPAVTAALQAGAIDHEDAPDDEFTFGLERILDGIEVLVRQRAEARRG